MLARMDGTTVNSKKITGGKNPQQHRSAFKVHNEIQNTWERQSINVSGRLRKEMLPGMGLQS